LQKIVIYNKIISRKIKKGAGFHPCPDRRTKEIMKKMKNAKSLERVEREREL